MWQIILFILLILGLILAVLFVFKPFQQAYTPTWVEVATEQVNNEVLGEKIVNKPQELADQSKSSLQQTVTRVAESVNKYIEEKFNQVLGNDKKSESVEVIVINQQDTSVIADEVLSFNLLGDKNKKFKLIKGKKYSFKFENLPTGFCVFINNQKYQINQDSLVQIQFSSSGNFPIKLDHCDESAKDYGQFEVN